MSRLIWWTSLISAVDGMTGWYLKSDKVWGMRSTINNIIIFCFGLAAYFKCPLKLNVQFFAGKSKKFLLIHTVNTSFWEVGSKSENKAPSYFQPFEAAFSFLLGSEIIGQKLAQLTYMHLCIHSQIMSFQSSLSHSSHVVHLFNKK